MKFLEFLEQQIENYINSKVNETTKELQDENAKLLGENTDLKATQKILENQDLLDLIDGKLDDNEIDVNEIMEIVCDKCDVNEVLSYIWDNHDYTFAEFAKNNLDDDTLREITKDYIENNL